jgi:hypothetical protein
MPMKAVTVGGRSATDIANEYSSAMRTIAARKGRLTASAEALTYADTLDALAEKLAVCVQAGDPTQLVATVEELNVAEAALEAVRQELNATVSDFLRMDTKSLTAESMAVASPQVVSVGAALSPPKALDAGG